MPRQRYGDPLRHGPTPIDPLPLERLGRQVGLLLDQGLLGTAIANIRSFERDQAAERSTPGQPLDEITLFAAGVHSDTAGILTKNGYETVADVQAASDIQLVNVRGMGPLRLDELRTCIHDLVAEHVMATEVEAYCG